MPEFTSPSFPNESDWSDDSSDLSFHDLEARLFDFGDPEAGAPVAGAMEPGGLAFDAEQQVIEATDLLPTPRASLRDDFIAEVAKIEQRRERLRNVPVAVAFLLLVSVCVLWPRSDETQAASVANSDNPLDRLPITAGGPAVLNSASQETDSWALVEAYDGLREKKIATIRKSFAADESL